MRNGWIRGNRGEKKPVKGVLIVSNEGQFTGLVIVICLGHYL